MFKHQTLDEELRYSCKHLTVKKFKIPREMLLEIFCLHTDKGCMCRYFSSSKNICGTYRNCFTNFATVFFQFCEKYILQCIMPCLFDIERQWEIINGN